MFNFENRNIMPAIIIHSLEMTEKQKKSIADKFLTIMSEETGVPKDRIYLFFNGYALDSVAVNGTLFSENPPRNARGKFNEKEHEDNLSSDKQ